MFKQKNLWRAVLCAVVIFNSGISTATDYKVSINDTAFDVFNQDTQQMTQYSTAWEAINAAIAGAGTSGGAVTLSSGTFPVGFHRVIASDVSWVSAQSSSVTVDNGVTGKENTATRISISDPSVTGLVAYYNFPDSMDISDLSRMSFWIKSDTKLSTASNRNTFVKFVMSESTNGNAPYVYSNTIFHPESLPADTWKSVNLAAVAGGYDVLNASSLTNVRSIGIVIYTDTGVPLPSDAYEIIVDDLHGHGGSITITDSNVSLVGSGAYDTVLKLNDYANVDVIRWNADQVEIADLQIDGNYDEQTLTDYCRGIYNYSASHGQMSILHDNYIHHAMGDGIKLRSHDIAIYENLIAWTENPNIGLTYGPYNIEVYNNTLKYPFNDDHIWLKASSVHDIDITNNSLYGMTNDLLDEDPDVPLTMVDKQIGVDSKAAANGIRNSYATDVTILNNAIYNIPGFGISINSAAEGVIAKNNHIKNIFTIMESDGQYSPDGISLQNWNGEISNIHVIENLIENTPRYGIRVNGVSHEIERNHIDDTISTGLMLDSGGSYHYGDDNFCPTGFVDNSYSSSVSDSVFNPRLPLGKWGSVINGGFEKTDGNDIDDWAESVVGVTGEVISSTDTISGSKSARLSSSAIGPGNHHYVALSQEIPVLPDETTVTISGIIKGQNIVVGSSPWHLFRITLYAFIDGEHVKHWDVVSRDGTFDWEFFKKTVVLDDDYDKLILKSTLTNSTGSAWVDDIKVTLAERGCSWEWGMLENGGFEAGGDTPHGWKAFSNGQGSGTSSWDDDQTHGLKSASIQVSQTGSYGWRSDFFPVEAGKKIRGEVMAKGNVQAGSLGWHLFRYTIYFYDENGNPVGRHRDFCSQQGQFGWTLLGNQYMVPTNAVKARVQLQLAMCTGEITFDNVKVYYYDND